MAQQILTQQWQIHAPNFAGPLHYLSEETVTSKGKSEDVRKL
jgi:hypothetical protein